MIKRKNEAYRVRNNIIKAIDALFDMNNAPFEYEDIDTAMRHFLMDYELDYDGFNGNLDDKMDALAEIIINRKIEREDLIDLESYLLGFLETKNIVKEILYNYNRENSDYKNGSFNAIEGIYNQLKR
jgi:hypothetical protein